MKHQHWHGFTDARFGYGSMLVGFIENKPEDVNLDPKASVNVHMGVPFSIKGWRKGQYRVCYTMWETDQLPVRFSRWLGQYDEILVPCKHNVPVFHEHHPKVNYVPLGVDTDWWKPMKRKPNDVFRFHAAGSLWRRKGLDKVVEAFNRLNLSDTELHIKAAPHASDVPTNIPGDRIFLHREWLTRVQQRDWFNQADCFVAPARGEGFGLIPLQAIALGVPTIITATSGQEQFSHLSSTVIGHKKVQCFMGGRWDEPDVDELVEAMRHHYHNRDSLAVAARTNAPKADEFSWKRAARKLADHLPAGEILKTAEWQDPHVLFDMEVTQKAVCEINGKRWEFAPGKVYSVPENVHDVMVANGTVKESK